MIMSETGAYRKPRKVQRCVNLRRDVDSALVVLAADLQISVSELVGQMIESQMGTYALRRGMSGQLARPAA